MANFSQFVGTVVLGRIFCPIYKKEAERICQECEPFIERGAKILDLGCGRGITAKVLENYFRAEIMGVDINDHRTVNLPFQIIDGKNLPFSDNSFDVILINYVLHHAESPSELLKEAKRVSKDKVIVHEDLEEGGIAQVICWLHKATYKISNPFQKIPIYFRNEKEWEDLFNKLGLKIIFKKRTFPKFHWLYPSKNVLFVLEK